MDDVFSRCLAEFEDAFAGPLNMPEMIQRVMDIMAIDQDSDKIGKVIGTVNKFKTQTSANISSAEEFVQLYNTKNNETLRIHTANPSSRYYRCKNKV